ncbi:alpha/beta family hydrolase [Paraferrimonas sp. SM1919]|uniref:alpha/beta family hydrolase n=1 Tax=Paraferrimonas sp. SM1919 TaxID=2662263 RepID=UPI0013D8CB75|nr:alpha/beta family hydrolase [Paraferrimonas sp. SM1919]
MSQQLWIDGPSNPKARVVFAHGAGAGSEHPFMVDFATALGKYNIEVVRFNFDYMTTMLETGKRRPPEKADKLLACFKRVIEPYLADDVPLFLMGKSMGGRMAAIMAETIPVKGVIALGYPFVPLNKKQPPRLAPILQASCPVLINQGERDAFGGKEDVVAWDLGAHTKLHWICDGDHSFKPRKSSGTTLAANIEQAAVFTKDFINRICDAN